MVAGCRVARYSERVQDRGRFMKALEDSLARLGTTAEFWQSHIRDVLARPEWRGSGYAASAGRNRAIAAKSSVHLADDALHCMAVGAWLVPAQPSSPRNIPAARCHSPAAPRGSLPRLRVTSASE